MYDCMQHSELDCTCCAGLIAVTLSRQQFFHGMELLQVYKQKVKHLLYEHQEDNAALRIEAEQQQKQASDEAERRVQELVTDKQNLQRELNEQACWPFPNLLSTQGTIDGLSKRLLLRDIHYAILRKHVTPVFSSLSDHARGWFSAMCRK
jgi:hypothetical protein